MSVKWFLLVPAILLDVFQGFIMLAFTGVMTGATGLIGFVPVVGTAAAGAFSAVGVVAGDVVDIGLSVGFGSFLVMLLILNGCFYLRPSTGLTLFSKLLLPFLPTWTAFVARSLYTKQQEDKVRLSHEALA